MTRCQSRGGRNKKTRGLFFFHPRITKLFQAIRARRGQNLCADFAIDVNEYEEVIVEDVQPAEGESVYVSEQPVKKGCAEVASHWKTQHIPRRHKGSSENEQ